MNQPVDKYTAAPIASICNRCKYGEFPTNDHPICRAPELQRTATEHPLDGHKCYREFDGGTVSYHEHSAPLCWKMNMLGNCPAFVDKQK